MSRLGTSARKVNNSRTLEVAARFGLAARGFVYVVIGWLALQIALGHRSQQANQRGALATVAQHPFGSTLLWCLGFGFAAYGLWRLSEAAFGTAAEGRKAGPRLQSLVRGVIYAGFAVSTFAFIAGTSHQTQNQQQVSVTADLMKHGAGRWIVAIAGVIVVIVGLSMVWDGIRKKFEKQLRMNELRGATRLVVTRLAMIGTTARGIVFGVTGALVVEAAVTFDPAKSSGLDGALRTLADRAYGPWLLGALAVGLIAFGLFGLACARFAKT